MCFGLPDSFACSVSLGLIFWLSLASFVCLFSFPHDTFYFISSFFLSLSLSLSMIVIRALSPALNRSRSFIPLAMKESTAQLFEGRKVDELSSTYFLNMKLLNDRQAKFGLEWLMNFHYFSSKWKYLNPRVIPKKCNFNNTCTL